MALDAKQKDRKKSIWPLAILGAAVGFFLLSKKASAEFVPHLGDVDLDGDVDINDAYLLSDYLEGKATLTTNQLKNADMDENGEVDQNDLSSLMLLLDSNTNYDGEIITG